MSNRQGSSAARRTTGATSRRTITGTAPAPRRPKKVKRHWLRNTFLTLLVLGLTAVAAVMATFIISYLTIEVPKPNQFARSQISTVYYADNETPIGKFAEVNRVIVDTKELPEFVGNAVVASEDRTFWTNAGIDLKGIARALWNNLRGGQTQGASTLAQQYVENYYLGKNIAKGNFFTRYWGKAKEAILALKITRQQPKEEVLDNYLNTIYFGRSSYGVEAAARAYFGKSAAEIDYNEAALLSAIIPAPSAWDPAKNPEKAQQRWQRVIKLMAQDKYITKEQADAAQFPKTIDPVQNRNDLSGITGYLLQQVRAELRTKADLTDDQIDTMGLRVVTSIDKNKQDQMLKAVAKLPAGHDPGLRVAMISTDPRTGEILAEYPGPDYLKIQTNAVTQDRFQAGSTFKPFGLIAGLEKGHTLWETYGANSPYVMGDGSKVINFGNQSWGTVNLRKATAWSINVPYIKLNQQVGPELTKEVAIRAGYPADTPGLDDGVRNVLGSASPHAIDIASAYNTIASGGIRRDAYLIKEVTDRSGDIIYIPTLSREQVFDKSVAANAINAMQAVVQEGSGRKAGIGRPAAAKTGTSSDNKSAVFAGFVPQMVTVVGLYQVGPNGEEQSITPFGGEREITGSTWPLYLWRNYMSQAVRGMSVESFPKPAHQSEVKVTRSAEPSEEPEETEEPEESEEPEQSTPPQQPSAPAPSQGPANPGSIPSPIMPGEQAPGGNEGTNNPNPGPAAPAPSPSRQGMIPIAPVDPILPSEANPAG